MDLIPDVKREYVYQMVGNKDSEIKVQWEISEGLLDLRSKWRDYSRREWFWKWNKYGTMEFPECETNQSKQDLG